jgi:cytochrome c oxidase cbb3-type subunit 4
MDINTLRILVTVLGFVCFMGIAIWAYSSVSKRRFDEAAMQPIADDDMPSADTRSQQQ